MGGCERARAVLQSEGADIVRRRADEGDAVGGARLGELGIFGEEAVARMDRARSGVARRLQDRGDIEIALRRRSGSDAHGDVGLRHMKRARVRFGIDRDRAQPHAAQRADDPGRDRAPVRDQDRVEAHAVTIIRTGVGLNALQGLLICGQFETTTITSISACRSTVEPGAEMPSTMPSAPSSSTGTFMKKLMFGTMSRLPRPSDRLASRKFSTQACCDLVWWP